MISYSFKLLATIVLWFVSIALSQWEFKCPTFQLIQPLDQSTGLSYALIVNGLAYIITNEEIRQKTLLNQPIPLVNGFQSPYNVMLFDNRSCNPNDYKLMAYKVVIEPNQNVYEWHTYLDLLDLSASRQWTAEEIFLPEILSKDPYINHYRFTFTMWWATRKNLYMIQLPSPGAPLQNHDYHAIQFPATCGDPYEYKSDNQMKIVDILKPWQDFKSCFIENNQIICFGPKKFSTFEIDLSQTRDGEIRVMGSQSNTTPNIPLIPIMQIICSGSMATPSTQSTPLNMSLTPVVTNATTIDYPTTQNATTTEPEVANKSDEGIGIILLIIVLLVIVLIISLLVWLYMCTKTKGKSSGQTFEGPTMRSGIGGQYKTPNSEMGSDMITRSQTTGYKNRKELSKSSALDAQRSQFNPNKPNKVSKNISDSDLEDHASMRSPIKPLKVKIPSPKR